jgi:hypothetical protein
MARVRASRNAYHKAYRKANADKRRAYDRTRTARPRTILALDGEGLTRDGVHSYNYLAICSDGKPVAAAESLGDSGLSTVECLDAIIQAKEYNAHSTIVGFSLGYDYTHIFRDLPNDKLYLLYRPELRRTSKGRLHSVRWRNYLLNYMRGRFSVTPLLPGEHDKGCARYSKPQAPYRTCNGCKRGVTATVWDIFGFYQSSFVESCKRWKVITEAERLHLSAMKENRSTFNIEQWQQIKDYCHLECGKLQDLFERLRDAHIDAGLTLKSFFGAGSSASVLLQTMGVKQCMPVKDKLPKAVRVAAGYAFFGGRFEVSRVGPYRGKVYSYDIASAYPYQATRLPCLRCGKWRQVKTKVRQSVEAARFALVRYSVHGTRGANNCSPDAWGPLPFRCKGVAGVGPFDSIIDDGSIIYPAASGGGWTYRDEYLVASKHWKVRGLEAWIYETDCNHKPFEALGRYYIERLRLGKEGAGIVIKLACNSCYGKLAQSVGKAQYQCALWAGAITSGCRAQLLELIAQAPESILSVATDGLVSTVPLQLPLPDDTGTEEAAKPYGKCALGAWESKEVSGGVMLIRPGIAFALAGEEIGQTKARGVGKRTLDAHKQLVLDSWRELGPKPVVFDSTIFRGGKSCITPKGEGFNRSPQYGQWVPRQTNVQYNPEPKRPFDTQSDGRLSTWHLPQSQVSAAYDRLMVPSHVRAIIAEREIRKEQPDTEDLPDVGETE